MTLAMILLGVIVLMEIPWEKMKTKEVDNAGPEGH